MKTPWWVLTCVACGTFMATLDSSIVNIALPTLTTALSVDLSQVKWVVIVYLLVITCLVLPFGKMSDQYGRKSIFQLGFILFTLGSTLCGLSPGLGYLVLARMLQAVGSSMLMANGPAIITAAVPATERGTALGTLAMVVSAGLISGPSIGGFLITNLGWRSIFWVNIPIGLLGLALAKRYIPEDKAARHSSPFDWWGAFFQTLFLISYMVGFDPPIISLSSTNTLLIPRWFMALVTLSLGGLFAFAEKKAKAPLLDISLLKNKTFVSSNMASFLTFVSFSSVLVLMPFFLERVMSYGPQTAGFFMTSIPLTILVVAPISGRLSDKYGSRGLSTAGAAVSALTFFTMAGVLGFGLHDGIAKTAVILALCAIGLGTGLFQSPNNNAIMSSVPQNKLGVASAMLATVRNLGLVTGTGLATALFSWKMELTGDFVISVHFAFLVSGLISCLAVIASNFKPSYKKTRKT